MLIQTVNDTDTKPADKPDSDDAPTPERLCRECGTPLPEHTGRGRKPVLCSNCKKVPSAPRTRKGTADTESALATMESMYQLTAGIMMLFSPSASSVMRSRISTAQAMNRNAFESDKDLARKIARMGEVSAMGTFVMSQAMIVAPTVGELRADMAERRAERRAAAAKENRADPATEPDGGIPATDVGFFG